MLKGLFLSERINQLSQHGYLEESKELQYKLQSLKNDNIENVVIALSTLQGINAEMMANLFQGNFHKALELLNAIEKQFNKDDPEQVRMYAHSALTWFISVLSG